MKRTTKPHKEKRNQHTVNCAYLERFADDNNKIYVFDKVTKKDFRKSPDTLTRRDYFYDTDDSSNQYVEEWFAKTVEPRLMSDLRHLDAAALRVRASAIGKDDLNLGVLGVPNDIRCSLAYAVILQELRTTIARSDMMQAMRTGLTKVGRLVALAEMGRDPGPLELHYGEYFEAQEHAKLFGDPEWFDTAKVVMRYPMALLLCEPGRKFYTSDNPVILYHPNPGENPGWFVPDVEIYFPISPHMALAFCNTPRFRVADDCLFCIDANFVDFLNARQTSGSNRHVFSASPNWDVARSTIEMFPDLSREDRPRTRVEVPDWFKELLAR